MAKIEVLTPIDNRCGIIYYTGFVNGEHIHFLADYKMSKREIKKKLLDRYNKIYNKEQEESVYGN